VLDFAADLGELMDQLHLPTVTPVGFSMGGLYVMALAVGHPERVRGATIISGIGLVDRPGGMDGLAPRMRRTFRSSRHTPRLARLEMQANVAAFKHRPAYAFGQMRAGKETLDPEFQRAFREALLEGARQGAGGFISDIAVGTGPWGFDPAEVGVPIQWWHGEKDRSIPLSHAQYLTGRLPNAELNVVRGGGHFMVHTNFESVLSGLMGHQKGSPARTGKVLK
jgi:pimeloyl-ACP methyl ester carboxylesterase